MKILNKYIQEKLRIGKNISIVPDFIKKFGQGEYIEFNLNELENTGDTSINLVDILEDKIHRNIPDGASVYYIPDEKAEHKILQATTRQSKIKSELYGNSHNQIQIWNNKYAKIPNIPENVVILIHIYSLLKQNKINVNDIYIYEAN